MLKPIEWTTDSDQNLCLSGEEFWYAEVIQHIWWIAYDSRPVSFRQLLLFIVLWLDGRSKMNRRSLTNPNKNIILFTLFIIVIIMNTLLIVTTHTPIIPDVPYWLLFISTGMSFLGSPPINPWLIDFFHTLCLIPYW